MSGEKYVSNVVDPATGKQLYGTAAEVQRWESRINSKPAESSFVDDTESVKLLFRIGEAARKGNRK